jgi:DNA-binding Lrp family transcriptional regulator
MTTDVTATLDQTDRHLIRATQGGLPLCPRPYAEIARMTNLEETVVMRRLDRMMEDGIIRRIGVVPNHYALGYRVNGMSVWDVPDQRVGELGRLIGALDFVSHSYHRPRHPPIWRYNLFAMVHGQTTDEVTEMIDRIATLLGPDCRACDVLYSKRILKKTGLRLVD